MSKAKYSGNEQVISKAPGKKNNSNSKKNGSASKTTAERTRKPYLTAALVLILVINIGLTLLLFNERRVLEMSFAQVPWQAWAMILTSIANVVAAAALWYWKRWGLYVYLGSALVSALVLVLAGMIGVGFGALAPALIVGYLFSLNWKQFE
jgi:hypothetical protein